MFNKKTTLTIALSVISSLSIATEYVVEQKDKTFLFENGKTQNEGMPEIQIKKGDSIKFLNADPFNHNIFSLSDIKFFDLGSYPQGESRIVNFDDAGEVEVECAIHPSMIMKVLVSE